MCSVTRRRMACTDSTKPSRPAEVHIERRHRVFVARAQLGVAGDGPGLQERLELPALGPAGVVALVRGEGPDQRPGLALRPEVGVHFPQAGLARRGRNGARDAGGQGRADRVGPGVVQLAGLDHVDDVDVGDVVQFAGAALAHADDGQADVCHFRGAELSPPPQPGTPPGQLRWRRRPGRPVRRPTAGMKSSGSAAQRSLTARSTTPRR